MGVPALFRWLSQKYPKIISQVIEERPEVVDGQEVPVNMAGPNPNGEEFDNLYLDMNGIVHPCSHPEDRPPPATEEEMMLAIFNYTDRVVNMVRPRKLLMIAVDGVAPRAKMNQQRSRRFRSAQEAKQKDEDNEEFLKMLKSKNGGTVHEDATAMAQKKTWDSNAITPGTPFMDILAASLKFWCKHKINTDPAWQKVKIILSDATVPGEGEHKIMEFVRSQRSSPEHDPNTRHVIYGLDADLIMLGLATHEPHFRVLREDVFFQESKARTCRICGQQGHIAEACKGEAKPKDGEFDEKDKALGDKPFIWLHVSVLREYLEAELTVPQQPFRFDLERALDDWVFMCFFVGNDFLPHLPSLDIRENGIDTLIAIWRDNIPVMGGYVTMDGHINYERCQFILNGLAKQEDAIFRRRRQTEERREAGAKRRKLDEQNRNPNSGGGDSYTPGRRRGSPDYSSPSTANKGRAKAKDPVLAPPDMPLFVPGKGALSKEERTMTHDMVVNRGAVYRANEANKSAAATLKSQLLGSNQTKEAPVDDDDAKVDERGSVDMVGDTAQSAEITGTPGSASKKRKAELMEAEDAGTPGRDSPAVPSKPGVDSDEPPPDNVRLWEEGYADRYYENKFHVDPQDIGIIWEIVPLRRAHLVIDSAIRGMLTREREGFRNNVAKAYVEGLAWVLRYYFQGCPSWTWYYPYHYAPFAADFVELDKMEITFDKGKPSKPFEQLMGVLPAASNHAIPEVFHPLMEEEDSEIIDFYPADFPIDLNGKKFAWQGVALLPFIDMKRLLDAMAKKYPLLSAEEQARNEVGKDLLVMSDRHPLYNEIATNFYSKRQGSPKYKLNSSTSEGLAGKIEKNEDYLPGSSLSFPLGEGVMPDLEEDHTISVHYEMPRSVHIHKSMLLRGIKFGPSTLNAEDIAATKGRANHSGRAFGGAPLGRGRGRGRGGQMSYAEERPNPFAAHISPGYGHGPPPTFGRGGPPPPGGQYNGYPPPPPRYHGGPPPAHTGYYNNPAPPQSGLGRHNATQPPPGTYHNGQGPTNNYGNSYYPPPPDGRYGGYNAGR